MISALKIAKLFRIGESKIRNLRDRGIWNGIQPLEIEGKKIGTDSQKITAILNYIWLREQLTPPARALELANLSMVALQESNKKIGKLYLYLQIEKKHTGTSLVWASINPELEKGYAILKGPTEKVGVIYIDVLYFLEKIQDALIMGELKGELLVKMLPTAA